MIERPFASAHRAVVGVEGDREDQLDTTAPTGSHGPIGMASSDREGALERNDAGRATAAEEPATVVSGKGSFLDRSASTDETATVVSEVSGSAPEGRAELDADEAEPHSEGESDSASFGSVSLEAPISTRDGTSTNLTALTRSGTAPPTPQETLRWGEIRRTRLFLWVAIGLCVSVVAASPFVGGDPTAKAVLLAGMAVIFVACSSLAWIIRKDERFTYGKVTFTAFMTIIGAFSGVYFFGTFSPAPIVIIFGLHFFSLVPSFRASLSVYLTCAFAYAFFALGMMTGHVADRGLIEGDRLSLFDQMMVVALVEATYLATFLSGRIAVHASLRALTQHEGVVRNLAQREALLAEARHELERALQAGDVGRYTDQRLGSYRLGAILGRGAMGDVYEARHVETDQPSAVKVLQAQMLGDPSAIRRFLREARIAASLDVENVVRVYEVGGVEALTPYIAMELLEGEDLAQYLRRHRRLSLRRTLTLVRDVGRGLDAARAAGIVHRDLKPRNVFLAKQGEGRPVWKILDFGVSKLTTAGGTLTGNRMIGTPAYMAPEQASGREVTHKTDLYALAVLCYRALTGRPAFAGKDLPSVLLKVFSTMPPRPSSLLTSLPEDVDSALAIGIAKSPEDRFERASELANALEAAGRGTLDGALRERARGVLAKHPWGSDL